MLQHQNTKGALLSGAMARAHALIEAYNTSPSEWTGASYINFLKNVTVYTVSSRAETGIVTEEGFATMTVYEHDSV